MRAKLAAIMEQKYYAKGVDVSIWADPDEEIEVCIWETGTSIEIKRFWAKGFLDVQHTLDDFIKEKEWLDFMQVN